MEIKPSFLLRVILPLFFGFSSVSSQFHEVGWYCRESKGSYTPDSTYKNNLNPGFSYLTEHALNSPFANYSVGEGTEKVNMIYNCRGDLTGQDCQECVKLASQRIVTLCPTQKEAFFWYRECMLRYSNRTIFSIEEEDPCPGEYSIGNLTGDPLPYDEVVAKTIDGLVMEAAYNKSKAGYAIGEGDILTQVQGSNKVYCLVQCTPDILGKRCERCLRVALTAIAGCCGIKRQAVQIYCPSCVISYSPVAIVRGASSPGFSSLPPAPTPPSYSFPPTQTKTGSSTSRMRKAGGDIFIVGLTTAASILFTVIIA